MKDKILSILLNQHVISAIIALGIIFFLPNYFTKYKVELLTQENAKGCRVYFEDLNNDYKSEAIFLGKNRLNKTSFMIFKPNGDLIDQWNTDGKFLNENEKYVSFFDVDNNNVKELYLTTKKRDSIFLNVIEPLATNSKLNNKVFVEANTNPNNIFDVTSYFVQSIEVNGVKELVFTLNAGFAGNPRNCYKYNYIENNISKSPHLVNRSNVRYVADIDNDGKPNIILKNNSSGNSIDSIYTKRSDYSTWLTVLDHNLNFLFKPIAFKAAFSSIKTIPIEINKSPHLLCLINSKNNNDFPDKLYVYSNKGELINEKELASGSYDIVLGLNNEEFILFNRERKKVTRYNYFLDEIRTQSIELYDRLVAINIDNDFENEWISTTYSDNNIIIYRNGFKHPINFELPANNGGDRVYYGLKQVSKTKKQLYFQKGDTYYLYDYSKNPFYPFRFLVYLGVFGFVLFLVWLILKGQKIRLDKKQAIENEIAELQIKTIKNQVDPHFVFNAINTISEMTLTDNKLEADNFICRFSDFMRQTLQNSDKISTTLKQELEYIENFIKLQQIRFNNSFDYTIEVDKTVSFESKVPKHVLFTYVENAIKHGLALNSKHGLLEIKVVKHKKGVLLSVQDNGIGMRPTKTSKKNSTGNGLLIMEKIFGLYSKLNNRKISHKLVELFGDNDEKAGLRVEVLISKTG